MLCLLHVMSRNFVYTFFLDKPNFIVILDEFRAKKPIFNYIILALSFY